jgi:hypothetical protein
LLCTLYSNLGDSEKRSLALMANFLGVQNESRANPKKLYILFKSCIINSQKYKSSNPDDNHMFSVIIFDMLVNGIVYQNLYADVRQSYQSDFEQDPIELTYPRGGAYQGPFPTEPFNDAVEAYYHSLVGQRGSSFGLEGVSNVHMTNNALHIIHGPVALDIPDQPEPLGAWILDNLTGWMSHNQQSSGTTPLGESSLSEGNPDTHKLHKLVGRSDRPAHPLSEPRGGPRQTESRRSSCVRDRLKRDVERFAVSRRRWAAS